MDSRTNVDGCVVVSFAVVLLSRSSCSTAMQSAWKFTFIVRASLTLRRRARSSLALHGAFPLPAFLRIAIKQVDSRSPPDSATTTQTDDAVMHFKFAEDFCW